MYGAPVESFADGTGDAQQVFSFVLDHLIVALRFAGTETDLNLAGLLIGYHRVQA